MSTSISSRDRKPSPEPQTPGPNRLVYVVGLILVALALTAALYVVLKSLHRVETGPVPPALRAVPPDTGYVIFRASVRRKARVLSTRCRATRKRLQGKLTPEQDSLATECDSAIARVLARVAAFDSVERGARRQEADSIRRWYERAKLEVRAFTRSGSTKAELDDDSLDRELKKLLGD